MFRNVKSFLEGKAPLEVDREGEPTSQDVQVATLILLGEIAYADDDFSTAEFREIVDVMREAFLIEEEQMVELLEIAETLVEKAERIDDFVSALKEHFTVDQRLQVISYVWKVILSDGRIDPKEQEYVKLLSTKLDLSEVQLAQAQADAKKSLDSK